MVSALSSCLRNSLARKKQTWFSIQHLLDVNMLSPTTSDDKTCVFFWLRAKLLGIRQHLAINPTLILTVWEATNDQQSTPWNTCLSTSAEYCARMLRDNFVLANVLQPNIFRPFSASIRVFGKVWLTFSQQIRADLCSLSQSEANQLSRQSPRPFWPDTLHLAKIWQLIELNKLIKRTHS